MTLVITISSVQKLIILSQNLFLESYPLPSAHVIWSVEFVLHSDNIFPHNVISFTSTVGVHLEARTWKFRFILDNI